MSRENVEIVRAIQPPSGTNLTELYELERAAERIEAVAPLFDPEFEFEAHGGVGERLRGRGLQALTEAWREWMQPFEIFWTEVEGFIDVDDDRVLVLIRDTPARAGLMRRSSRSAAICGRSATAGLLGSTSIRRVRRVSKPPGCGSTRPTLTT
jgi:hypothetical protein